MRKTPLSRPFDLQLNDINDQLCFAALVTEEADKVIAPGGSHPSSADTVSLFPGNPHATRILRSAEDLPGFAAKAVSTNCRSALIAASEYLQIYCENALVALRTVLPAVTPAPTGGKDERLQAHLIAWGAPVVGEIFDTLVYLRRRRNNLVHANEGFSAEFETFLVSGAPALAAFWRTRPVTLNGFDFGNRQIDVFSVLDGYAIMNLFRICLAEVDGWVAGSLPLSYAVEPIVAGLLANGPGLRGDIPRLVRKARAVLDLEYGARPSLAILEPVVRALV